MKLWLPVAQNAALGGIGQQLSASRNCLFVKVVLLNCIWITRDLLISRIIGPHLIRYTDFVLLCEARQLWTEAKS